LQNLDVVACAIIFYGEAITEDLTAMALLFSGIGGSGMLPLAMILQHQGKTVFGSDRSRDQGKTPEKFAWLEAHGIEMFAQDGSGSLDPRVDTLVISTAVEPTVPDVAKALERGLTIKKRAEVLADCINSAPKRVIVAGTSGKSTTTGMLGYILHELGKAPTVMNGAVFRNYASGSDNPFCSALLGNGDIFVAEGDESDGSLALYQPSLAVLNNISLDHADMDELKRRFSSFINKAPKAIVNLDDAEAATLLSDYAGQAITTSLTQPQATYCAMDIVQSATSVSAALYVRGQQAAHLTLNVPGLHNLSNALQAIATAAELGCSVEDCCRAIAGFAGVKRRLETVGTSASTHITVIDDFAHNPDKIAATLRTLRQFDGRLVVYFQPHGFGPLRLMRHEFVQTFAQHLAKDDVVVMPEPYYAGGTVDRSVTSHHLIEDMLGLGLNAYLVQGREEGRELLLDTLKPHDRLVIMGARDDTLSVFARELLQQLDEKQQAAVRA
jgi:UDP-N-acetylmuramate--alanine ligase